MPAILQKDEGTAPGTAGRSHTSVYTVHGCDPQVTGEERESKKYRISVTH